MNDSYTSVIANCIRWGFVRTHMNGPNNLIITKSDDDLTLFLTKYKNNLYLITFGPTVYELSDVTNLKQLLYDLRKSGNHMVTFPDKIISTYRLTQILEAYRVKKIIEHSQVGIKQRYERQDVADDNKYIVYMRSLNERLEDQASVDKKSLECSIDALVYIYLHNNWSDFIRFRKLKGKKRSTVLLK